LDRGYAGLPGVTEGLGILRPLVCEADGYGGSPFGSLEGGMLAIWGCECCGVVKRTAAESVKLGITESGIGASVMMRKSA
jgi:hypothetical protein